MITITAEAPLAPGDVVQLKSGGPAMTIDGDYLTRDGVVCSWNCKWFVDGEVRLGAFTAAALRRAAPTTMPQAAPPSAEPDAWQGCVCGDANGPIEDMEPPMRAGYIAAGPWCPIASTGDEVMFWRRPLRSAPRVRS